MKDSSNGMAKIRRRAQRGVSLIEILVVLVLLVLGILIIVRLYPSGFFSITSVGNAALADSLGQAAVQSQAQDTSGLPETILPVNSTTKDLSPASAADASYDPDDPTLLDNARVINNETIAVPAATAVSTASVTTKQSIYIVNYGPIVMPVTMTDTNLPKYLTINSLYWQALSGNFNDSLGASPAYPQEAIFPGQQRVMVDYTNGKVAVPYAQTYDQPFVLMVLAHDPVSNTDKTYTLTFKVPHSGAAGPPVTTDAHDYSFGAHPPFYADSQTYYNGDWFDPIGSNTNAGGQTYKYNTDTSPTTPPLPWKAVMLYRPFHAPLGTASTTNPSGFSTDPYEFTLTSPNITDPNSASLANVGAISFNPLGAGGSGVGALKARVSYLTYSWKVLHEDRDIPALTGTDTTATRLTLKNLKRAGDNNPDNSIYSGMIPNSFLSMIALDLDTGKMAGNATPVPDPTAAEGNIWDEDLNGATPNPTDYISVSFSTGRVTFEPNSFGDNPTGNTPHTHRVRLFYVGDADWTVAVQKAPSYYALSPNSAAAGADPMLLPGQYAFDGTQNLYFPRSDAEKSVEIDGTYVDTSGSAPQLKTFAGTIAIPPVVTTVGTSSYVTVSLTGSTLTGAIPGAATVTQVNVTAVRGLSVRSVVAWKERDRWKVHSVDTLLSRAQ